MTLLERALANLPRKGGTEPPKNLGFVTSNLHGWAIERGFLSAAIFVAPPRNQRGKPRARLLVAKRDLQGRVRFFTANLRGE